MAQEEVLIVEDHSDIVELLEFHLGQAGFKTSVATNGVEGHEKATKNPPNLVLLDIMLPKMDGFEVCKILRENDNTKQIPIIMLTAKGEESDIVKGLELGADDYVTKPFSPKELLARVKALLRRTGPANHKPVANIIESGPLKIDVEHHEVSLDGESIHLTLTEFQLAKTLLTTPGRIFTRNQLIDKVRGDNVAIVDRNIDVHISSLRKKLKDTGQSIKTIRGVGYRFKD